MRAKDVGEGDDEDEVDGERFRRGGGSQNIELRNE